MMAQNLNKAKNTNIGHGSGAVLPTSYSHKLQAVSGLNIKLLN
jgi:hypothetical protein